MAAVDQTDTAALRAALDGVYGVFYVTVALEMAVLQAEFEQGVLPPLSASEANATDLHHSSQRHSGTTTMQSSIKYQHESACQQANARLRACWQADARSRALACADLR